MKSRRCAAEGCNKYPAFNLPGENTARFCGDHRQPGMIDVHNKRCAFEGCQKRPTFNYVGELPSLQLWGLGSRSAVCALAPRLYGVCDWSGKAIQHRALLGNVALSACEAAVLHPLDPRFDIADCWF